MRHDGVTVLVTFLITGAPGEMTTMGTFPADTALPTDALYLARNSTAASPTHSSNISTTHPSSGVTIMWHMV